MPFWIKLSVFSGIGGIASSASALDSPSMTLLETPIDIFCQSPLVSVHPSNHPPDAATPILGTLAAAFLASPREAKQSRNLKQ